MNKEQQIEEIAKDINNSWFVKSKGVQAGFDMTKFKEQSIKNKASKETAEKFATDLKKVILERDYILGLCEEIDDLLKEYEK